MEAIPYIGPVLAAVPPTLVALFHAPITALWVIVVFILIQQVEGHILVPVDHGQPLPRAPAHRDLRDPRRR